MNKTVIAVDFDDVVGDFNRAFLQYHNQVYGTAVRYEDITDFSACNIFGAKEQDFFERLRAFCNEQHESVQPVAGAVAALQRLHKRYALHVVTSRCESSMRHATEHWLNRWVPDVFSDVHYTNGPVSVKHEAQHKLKSSVCHAIGAAVLIDDALHHAEDAAKANIPVLLPDRPWNQGALPTGVSRLHSWESVVNWIEAKTQ